VRYRSYLDDAGNGYGTKKKKKKKEKRRLGRPAGEFAGNGSILGKFGNQLRSKAAVGVWVYDGQASALVYYT